MSTQEAERDQDPTETETGSAVENNEPAPAIEAAPGEGNESASAEQDASQGGLEPPATTESSGPKKSPAAPTSAPSATTESKSVEAPSAGQRIAAQRAAKAAKKAAEKARRADDAARAAEEELASMRSPRSSGPDEVEIRAAEVSRIVESNTSRIVRAGAVIAVLVVVGFAVQFYLGFRAQAAGRLLSHALAASSASIGPNPETPDGRLHFGNEAARDREAMRRYRRVVADYPNSEAARRSHLAIAVLLIQDGKFVEAQAELRKARTDLDPEDFRLDASLREARGLAFLGQSKYAEAQREFEALARIDRPRNVDVADYLIARTLFERGNRDGAKTRLTALLDRLDDTGATPAPHVEDQARALLRQIDPSAVSAPASPGGIDFSNLPPELIRALQERPDLLGGSGGQ